MSEPFLRSARRIPTSPKIDYCLAAIDVTSSHPTLPYPVRLSSNLQIGAVTGAVRDSQNSLSNALLTQGALLFCGLPIHTLEDFAGFVTAFAGIPGALRLCLRIGAEFRWLPCGILRISQVRPSTAIHPAAGEEVWFNRRTASIRAFFTRPSNDRIGVMGLVCPKSHTTSCSKE